MTSFDFTYTIEQLGLTLDCNAEYDIYLNVSNITVFIDGTDYDLSVAGLDSVAVQSAKGQWVTVESIIRAEADFAAERHAEDNVVYQIEARAASNADRSMEGVR